MQFGNDFAKGYSFIQLLSGQLEFFRQSGSDDGHWEASILRGSEGSKLELVASVSVWTRAISISVFLVNIKGETEHSILQILLLGALFPIDESADCLPQIGWNDSRRRLMATESDLVSRRGDSSKVKGIVSFKCWESNEDEQFEEFMVISAGNRKHIFDLILLSDIVDWPICMFSTSVESREGFLVQKHSVTVAIEDFLQDLHSN